MSRKLLPSASLTCWNSSVTCQTSVSAGLRMASDPGRQQLGCQRLFIHQGCSFSHTEPVWRTNPKPPAINLCVFLIKFPPSSSSADLQCLFSPQKRMEYMAVNPNATQTSGSCGTVQSELNITFSGGFINLTFVKVTVAFIDKECLGLGNWNFGCI